MRKDIFIELVYEKCHAFRPSEDFVVLRSDIEAYLPAAVNFVLTAGYWEQQSAEGNRDIPTQFYHYYTELQVITSQTNRRKPYFQLPANLVALASNRGLRKVFDDCEHPYTPMNDNQMSNIDYWTNILTSQRFYRLEGKKVFLYNKPPLVKKMSVLMLVETTDLQPEDQLSIPAGKEGQAIDICYEFVTGKRVLPVDNKVDDQSKN